MQIKNSAPDSAAHTRLPLAVMAPVIAALLMVATPARALQFEYGEINGSFDTTLSYGALIRAESRDPGLIGIANGGTARSVNGDDGDLNYNKFDLVNSLFKATHDLEVNWRNFGLFVRGSEFFDTQVAEELDKFGPRGRDRLQTDYQFLDAFVSGRFDLFGKRSTGVRIGWQVISWGESTFIQNGINIINPVDVSKLRTPNAELKEALIPLPALLVSQELTDELSFEGFVLARFDEVKLDPRGAYFSTTDIAADDGDRAIVSFGRRKDQHFPPSIPGQDPAASVYVTRNQDRNPNGAGQFGLALHYLATDLGSTEFGVYFIDYINRTPLVSVIKSNSSLAVFGTGTTSVLTGTANEPPTQNGSARYFLEYPKDIKVYGISFNTLLPGGVALQGEYTYRPNLPRQLAATELVLSALNLPSAISPNPTLIPAGSEISGFKRVDAHQVQVTATTAYPQVFGANQVIALGEVGYNYLDLPSGVLFDGPGAGLPALQSAAVTANGSTQNGGYATRNSYGFRALTRADYLGVFGLINVSPRLAYSYDIKGVGPNFNEGSQAASVGVNLSYQQVYQADFSYTSFFGGREYCGTDPIPFGTQPQTYCTAANPNKDRDFIAVSFSYSF